MATSNPFDILGDDDSDDPAQLIAAQQHNTAAKKLPQTAAATALPATKLPSKPLPPSQAVREARNLATGGLARGFSGQGGRSRGRVGQSAGLGSNRDFVNDKEKDFTGGNGSGVGSRDFERSRIADRGRLRYDGPRPAFHGTTAHSEFGDGQKGRVDLERRNEMLGGGEPGSNFGRPPRMVYERRVSVGRGFEVKRDATEKASELEGVGKIVDDKALAPAKTLDKEEKPLLQSVKDIKDGDKREVEEKEKEEEDKEMTLIEYEKIREEKREALLRLKAEVRKVIPDEEFGSMKQLTLKKGQEVFIKLGSDRDAGKRKENIEKDERAKKSVSINDFLKPSEGDRYFAGRGRGRELFRGGFDSGPLGPALAAPLIEDHAEFPALGGK